MPSARFLALVIIGGYALTAKGITIPAGDGPPIQLDITNTADFDYHFFQGNGIIRQPGEPQYDPTANYYFDWLNKLDTKLTYGPWHAELRLDSAVFWNVYDPGADTGLARL